MIHLEILRVLDDLAQVTAALHVVLATVKVVADVRNLLVLAINVVPLALLEVVHVHVVFVVDNDVALFLCNLENHFIFLAQVRVVRVHEHELVVIRHVVILLHFHVLLGDVECHIIHLNNKLWVFVNEERSQVFMLPLGVVIRIIQIIDVL